jgi:hypothetical protein
VATGTAGGSACAGAGAWTAAGAAGLPNGAGGLLNGAANGGVAGLPWPGALPAAWPVAPSAAWLVAPLAAGLVTLPAAWLVALPVAGALRVARRLPAGALPVAPAASGDAAAAPASPFSLGAAAAVLRRVRLAGRRAAVPPSAWSPEVPEAAPAGVAAAGASAAGVAAAAAGTAASVVSGGAEPAAGLAVRRLVVRLRGAAVAAGASVRPDGPLLPDPSLLDSVPCSSLSSIRAISRQAPGRGRPQRPVRSARELVARDIPAGTCRLGGATGARYL